MNNVVDHWIERTALVVDDSDSDQQSRVKVRVYPELKDVIDADLPWARPLVGIDGYSDSAGIHRPPEKDSFVRVRILPMWNSSSFYYVRNEYLEGIKNYDLWANNIEGNISDIDSQSYPQPRFQYLPDGTCVFFNSSSGETGIFHSSGSYAVFNKDGKPFVYVKADTKIYNDHTSIELKTNGDFVLTNDAGSLEFDNSGDFTLDNGSVTLSAGSDGSASLENSSGSIAISSIGQVSANSLTVDP